MFQITEFKKEKLDTSSITIVDKYESRCEEWYTFAQNMLGIVDYDYDEIYEYIRELNNRLKSDEDKLTRWLSVIGVDNNVIEEIKETLDDLTGYVETQTDSAEALDDLSESISENANKFPPEEPYKGIATTIANTAKETVEAATKTPEATKAVTEVANEAKAAVNNAASKEPPAPPPPPEVVPEAKPDTKATLADLAKAAEDSKKSAGDIVKDAFTPDIVEGIAGIVGAGTATTSPGYIDAFNSVKDVVTNIIKGETALDMTMQLKDIAIGAGASAIASYAFEVVKGLGVDYLNNIDKQAFADSMKELTETIDQRVSDYLKDHPNASRTEVQSAIIDGFREAVYSRGANSRDDQLVNDWIKEANKQGDIDKTIAVALGLEYNGIDIPLLGPTFTGPNNGVGGLTPESAQKLEDLYAAIANAASEAYDAAHSGSCDTGCGCNHSCDSSCDSCGGDCDDCGCDHSCDDCNSDCDSCLSDYCTGDAPCDIVPCDSCGSDCDVCTSDCDTTPCDSSCDCSTDGYCDCGCDDPSCGGDNA